MVTPLIMVYSQSVESVASNTHGSRRSNQDETSPLELEIVARRKRVVRREGRSQDETSPFPLEFEVVARKTQESQEETSPFLLEFKVILADGEPAFVRTARPPRSPRPRRSSSKALPVLKWHGVEASLELREYAARIASGEALPPFRGPILANGEFPCLRPERPARGAPHAMPAAPVDDSKASVKFLLALIVMAVLIVAAALLGDDAQLRDVGQSIRRWGTGMDDSFRMHRPSTPASSPAFRSSAPQR